MPGENDGLLKVYINNLNLPPEKKKSLLESNPKTLSDISLWLDKHDDKKIQKPSVNPFSPDTKIKIAKEIQLFSTSGGLEKGSLKPSFMSGGIVDVDDKSWGLSIDKSQSVPDYQNTSAQDRTRTNYSAPAPVENEKEAAKVEAQDNAIASIKENVNSAIEAVMNQKDAQGVVSKGYNTLKEYFKSEMAMSSVCRVIYAENTTAELLEKAQSGKLTVEEYYKAKIGEAVTLLTGNKELSAEDRALLEERLSYYSPEELNNLIDRIKYCNNEDYAKLNDNVDKLIEEAKTQSYKNKAGLEGGRSINGIIKQSKGSGKELMTFAQVFKMERGVDFDPEKVAEYDEAASKYAMAAMITNKAQSLHETLGASMRTVRYNQEGNVSETYKIGSENNLEQSLLTSLKSLYGEDEEKINQELQMISDGMMTYKDGKITYNDNGFIKTQKDSCLLNASQKLLDKVDNRAKEMLGTESLDDYKDKMASCYENAYGRKNATQLARAFENDQEGVVQKVRTGVEIGGTIVAVGGMFIAMPVAFAGALVASYGGIGVEALNEATRKEGMSEEAKQKLSKELATNTALFAIGGAAGKAGSAAKAALIAEKCPTLMACIADIGVDATISLLGDMALTGQIDLQGEGLSQIMSLLAGKVRAGKFGKNRLSHQDINPAKNPLGNHALEDLKRSNPKLYEDYQYLRSKNLLPESAIEFIYNPEKTTLNKNLQKEISMLAEASRNGTKPIDAFVPKLKSLTDASKLKQMGEVFSLEGTNDVYIMDAAGPIKLDMDRDMYFALFPPLKSYSSSQGAMGDCYFVSSVIDGAMNNPKAKVEMLKMFHQKGNDISIDLKEYNAISSYNSSKSDYDNCPSEVVFKDAKKRLSSSSNAGISGAEGLKLIEEAYGYKLAAAEISDCMKALNIPEDKQKQIFEELAKVFADENYKPSKEFDEILQKTFNGSKSGIIKNYTNVDTKKAKTLKDGIDELRQQAIGNGGSTYETLENFFGLTKDATEQRYLYEDESIIRFAEAFENNPNIIMTASTHSNNQNPEKILEELQMLFKVGDRGKTQAASQHAYRIESINKDKKTISIINPWDTSKTVELTFDQFKKLFERVYATDISKTVSSEISKSLVSKMDEQGLKTSSSNGRLYSNEELITKYAEKLKNEKNLDTPSTRYIDADDFIDESLYQTKSLVMLHNKLVDKYGNQYAESIMKVLTAMGDESKKDIESIVKNLDKLLFDPDIDRELLTDLVQFVHTDYNFITEKAPDIIKKLKAKGFNKDFIMHVLQNISKENYDEMKKIWE